MILYTGTTKSLTDSWSFSPMTGVWDAVQFDMVRVDNIDNW